MKVGSSSELKYLNDTTEDAVLLGKIVNGNISAYEHIFKKYYGDLYGYGLKLCGDPELVKDMVQELFTMIWERKHDLGHILSLKVYLLVVLRRRMLNALKEKRHERTIIQEYKWEPDMSFSIEEIIIEDEKASELKEKLIKAINSLPDRQREVLYLRFYNGMSYEEIEEILSINYQSIRNHVHRAMTRLREIMHEETPIIIGLLIICFEGIIR